MKFYRESFKAVEEPHIFTVSEICRAVDGKLKENFSDVWVRGELSRFTVYQSGHAYFTLKDADSCLKAVMFRGRFSTLKFAPEEGLEVILRGAINIYSPKGDMQIIAQAMEPCGRGALQLAFEQLKERLAKEGLFDEARKKPIPFLPQVVGVVTSLDGAALRDFLRVSLRRRPNMRIIIAPSTVQGETAKYDICEAIDRLEKFSKEILPIDVIVLTRGGGSIEDLWAFNEEMVARKIADCSVPTINAVGHEVDFTIADFVADFRASTPSAAAERVAPESSAVQSAIVGYAKRLTHTIKRWFERQKSALDRLAQSRGFATMEYRIAEISQRLDSAEEGARRAVGEHFKTLSERLERFAMGLEQLSPLAVLGRGYSICYSEDKKRTIKQTDEVNIGDRVYVRLRRGMLGCDVKEKENPRDG